MPPLVAAARGWGYSGGDGVRQQFTQKERDVETGLDYFFARYYSSTQGRFTSPDEFTGGPVELYIFAEEAALNPRLYAEPENPQSLNKYQYTYNNPLRYTDPTGHCIGPTLPLCVVGGTSIVQAATPYVLVAVAALATAVVVRDSKPGGLYMDNCRACRDMARAGERDLLERIDQENSKNNSPKEVVIDGSKHPESAANAADAQKAGKPSEVTVDRPNAPNRRKEALEGTKKVPGKDRDEYPPAVFKEGGRGAQVRPINPSDNRGAGASIGRQLKGVANGEKVNIVIKN